MIGSGDTESFESDEAWAPFIEGKFCISRSKERLELVNPSNEARLHRLASGNAADVDLAVQSARRAFADGRWSRSQPSVRKQVLAKFSELVATDQYLDLLDAEEMGKPLSLGRANARAAASLLSFFAEAVDKVDGNVLPSDKDSLVISRFAPMGVVGAIVPWNFPTYNALLKIAPALAAGNSVVIKPSEFASRSAVRLAQIAIRAGLPPGVLNVVPGRGGTVGETLARHGDVDMIAFTGSTLTGRRILEYSGSSNMKRVIAECGGKGAHIVFDDGVDYDGVAAAIAQMILANQGQICSTGSRLVVERSIVQPLVDRLVGHFERVRVGPATDPDTEFGPLATSSQLNRVHSYVTESLGSGASTLTGGQPGASGRGYFYPPTLIANIAPDSRLAREEIFGPVLCILPFDSEDEAIQITNGTSYGLLNFIWTENLSRALRVSRDVRSSVLVNPVLGSGEGPGHSLCVEPWGNSGVGVEGGLAGLISYLRRQLVWVSFQ